MDGMGRGAAGRGAAAVDGQQSMKIGEVSQRTGVPTPLLRYYEKRGLLGPDREANGFRSYSPAAVERVTVIRRLLNLGLGTSQIREFLHVLDGSEPTIDQAGVQTLSRIVRDLDQRISELKRVRRALQRHIPVSSGPSA